jgi:hypothetical protein
LLRKEHVAPLIECGSVVWAIAGELVAKVRQPEVLSISLNQPVYALAAVAIAFGATDLEEANDAVKVAEGERRLHVWPAH